VEVETGKIGMAKIKGRRRKEARRK